MFDLMTYSTFYLKLYGVGHMVKDHSDSKRGNLLPPLHGLLFMLPLFQGLHFLYAQTYKQDNIYCNFSYTSCGALARKRKN